MLSKKTKQKIQDKCDWEGPDYAFVEGYFDDIPDIKLHELINKYMLARKELFDYCDLE